VTDELPPSVAEVVARIEAPPPAGDVVDLPGDVTGSLADLLGWWRALSADRRPLPARISVGTQSLDVPAALSAGITAADAAIDSGKNLIVPRVDTRDDLTARAVISLLTRREASRVLHQPAGVTDRDWMSACASVRDRSAEATEHRGSPVDLLDALGATAIAAAVGVLLGAAARRTPCLVDGTDELAAALVADRLCFRAKAWWRAASDSPDPGRIAAIERMDLTAGLTLMLTDDVGRGADATLALLDLLSEPVD